MITRSELDFRMNTVSRLSTLEQTSKLTVALLLAVLGLLGYLVVHP
jgi:hypothetical protein